MYWYYITSCWALLTIDVLPLTANVVTKWLGPAVKCPCVILLQGRNRHPTGCVCSSGCNYKAQTPLFPLPQILLQMCHSSGHHCLALHSICNWQWINTILAKFSGLHCALLRIFTGRPPQYKIHSHSRESTFHAPWNTEQRPLTWDLHSAIQDN